MKIGQSRQSVAFLAVMLSMIGGGILPAIATPPTRSNMQLAQATLVGQCRAVKTRIFVYSQRSTSSQTLRTLAVNEQVTLADNGSAGFIAISSPETGYVQARDLTTCTATTTPTPTANRPPAPTPTPNTSLCRVVVYPGEEGLAIRSGPNRTAARVGGVMMGNRLTLRTSPPPFTYDSDRRAWVEVTAPTRGWISYGFPSTKTSNIGACP